MIRSLFCCDSPCVFANLSYFLSFPASMAFLLERRRQIDLTSRLRSLVARHLSSLPPSARHMAVLREAFTGCPLPLPHLPLPGIQTLDPETVMLEHYSMMGSIISEETREAGVLPPFRNVLERYSRMVYWRSFLSTQANALVELGVTGDPEVPGTFFEVCPPPADPASSVLL